MFLNLDFDGRVARGFSLFGTDLLVILGWVLLFTWVEETATVSCRIISLLQGFLRFIDRWCGHV